MKVDNMLYKLDCYVLCKMSDLFSGMFSLPLSEANTRQLVEGMSDDKPVMVPEGVTSKEFDHLIMSCIHLEYVNYYAFLSTKMTYWYRRWTPLPYPIKHWIDILKLASQWGFKSHVIDIVIFELEKYGLCDFPAIEKLHLACCYNIPQFVALAMQDLCHCSSNLTQLSSNSIHHIGLLIYKVISKTKERMNQQCTFLAFHAPLLSNITPDPACEKKRHKVCASAWKWVW